MKGILICKRKTQKLTYRAASPEPSPPNSGTSFSRLLQPAGELLRRDHAAVAVLFFLSGFLTPGVERTLGQLAGIDTGETLFVLPAIFLELHPQPSRGNYQA